MKRSLLALALLLAGCGGGPDDDGDGAPTGADTAGGDAASAGGATEVTDAAAAPSPEEARDFFTIMGAGVTPDARARMSAASYQAADIEQARAACLQVLEAFLAENYTIFDLDRQCLRHLDRLGQTHGVDARPDVQAYRALQAQAQAEYLASLPPLPDDFAPVTGPASFDGELSDDDPVMSDDQSAYDDHPIDLRAGSTITIDMTSPQFDTYVWLLDAQQHSLAQDDDGGEGLNSHLEYPIDHDGRYIVRANAFSARGRGSYHVQVVVAAPSEAP